MVLKRLLSGDPSKSSKLYLAIGVLSLVKAIAVRKDPNRFRRELLDAGLFLGVGIALRKYSQLKAQKRSEIESQLPNWLGDVGGSEGRFDSGSESTVTGFQSRAKERLQGRSEPEPSLRDRARGIVSSQ
ncbi:hypothetical protein EA462_03205 [Natrarchaeobius halalkaliphilus]|uniref:Uncharacterized protein n=1 Tax=Natrarchaeobius halalkaliphilus TaxID=1679091 RepID=A0A3N6PA56_9EURY|nr:hypothetical protein [Natrarchaeobius halalkaliphilus]RQG93215.1 hypothetical protein EA462_03205 [Natrarchaeobius halalkaliphilus]